MNVAELGALFPILITEHRPEWKKLFLKEKKIILKALGADHQVRIRHIGSTAVPGLPAKPTIDILIEVDDKLSRENVIEKITSAGYLFIPRPDNPPPHMMFVKGYTTSGFKGQAYHIHVRYFGDWDEPVFRDYLISHPDVALEYAELKRKLAFRYPNDREQYTDGKGGFISHIVKVARKESDVPERK